MTRIIAVVGQKGGIGKTSLVQNLGAELASAGQRVLLADLDPQSNLTSGWGIDPAEPRPTVYDAMLRPADAYAYAIPLRPGLDLLPANLDLAGAEREFGDSVTRPLKLKKALAGLSNRYDFVIIDSPPSLGFFSVNALAAATEALIPLQCQVYAFRALDSLLEILAEVQEVNPALRLSGVVLTMYDVRNALTFTVERLARERFGNLVFETTIPVNIRIAEAPASGVPVAEYEPTSKGAEAYRALALEVLQRGG